MGTIDDAGRVNRALTPRQAQVLRGMAEGVAYKVLAPRLNMSHSTLKVHAGEIFRRLGARNKAHAVAIAMRGGLL